MNHPLPSGLPEWADPSNTTPLPLKLRLEDYLVLDGMGMFEEYARTELIDGEIIYMNAQHRPHARTKLAVYEALKSALREASIELTPFVEASLSIPPRDAPEPDLVLTSEPEGDGLIPIHSVSLVIEISDASIRFDLGRKRERYAELNIPEYWVFDIGRRLTHQFWASSGDDFAERRERPFGEPIASATIGGLLVPTDGLG